MLQRRRSTRDKQVRRLAFVVFATSFRAAASLGAGLEPAASARVEHAELGATALRSGSVCEAPRCIAVDGAESCTACRVWDYAATSLDEESVRFESQIVENGVVLRVTSEQAHVRQLLWTVSVARHQILELLRQGGRVPLCAACHANVQAFADVELGTSRIPDGVLLMYTSGNPYTVDALHAIVFSGADLPL